MNVNEESSRGCERFLESNENYFGTPLRHKEEEQTLFNSPVEKFYSSYFDLSTADSGESSMFSSKFMRSGEPFKNVSPIKLWRTGVDSTESIDLIGEGGISADTLDSLRVKGSSFENSENKERLSASKSKKDKNNPTKETKKKKLTSPGTSTTDRFIPSRRSSNLHIALSGVHEETRPSDLPKKNMQCSMLNTIQIFRSELLSLKPLQTPLELYPFKNTNLLKYKENQMPFDHSHKNYNSAGPYKFDPDLSSFFMRSSRKISKNPFKVLDAPSLQDDFYLNLIDWSSQNVLAVGLGSCVYLWSGLTSIVTKLCDLGGTDAVTSVGWAPKGILLGIGTVAGDIQVWDTVKLKKLRTLQGHSGRVGSLCWNSKLMATGSRDKNICLRDIRSKSNIISRLQGHKQEVCGLKMSFDEQQLASGGNDNKLMIWNLHSHNPVTKLNQHVAAVKALAWSPHQHGLLASGGGTADRTIRFWNTLNNTQISSLDTGSQVCNLLFGKNVNEVVSTHGYSLNQIVIWSYPYMEKITTLTGHSFRVLYLAMSPDGQNIVTGAGDETLRFWNVFPPPGYSRDTTGDFGKLSEFVLR